MISPRPQSSISRRTAQPLWLLLAVFASLYFVQGMVEPTAGMPAQLLQSRLARWGYGAADIGQWIGLLAVSWSLKPFFGVLSDFVPIFGSRRRAYLILSTGLTTVGYSLVYLLDLQQQSVARGMLMLLVANAGIAVTDVVIDALAVEIGQPRGATGQFQSVQWGAVSVATIFSGIAGGMLAERGSLRLCLLVCATLSLASFLVALVAVREPVEQARSQICLRSAGIALLAAVSSKVVWLVGGFLFLWNFNPFSSTVLQLYATQQLGWSETFYGFLISVQYSAAVVACFVYGFLCRRIRFRWLVHVSIAMGVVNTAAYWAMTDQRSAIVVTLLVGFAYMLGTLVQLDLAARVCPTDSAGTTFATLMAVSNTGISLSAYVGGVWYDQLAAHFGNRHTAFHLLVGIGALFTCTCWLLVPPMQRLLAERPAP